MATIFRALCTSVLLLWGYVVSTGWHAGDSPGGLAWHLRVGLVGALLAAAVQSLPFAYFLGTRFWVKAFVRASRAGDSWVDRQNQWMRDRAYPAMYLTPLLTMAVAISGSLVETGRIPGGFHPALVLAAFVGAVVSLITVPPMMSRNSALMDELADTHHVPEPDTPEMESLLAEEERGALPPLFQLSRLLLLFAAQSLILWLYLRFGTERFREAPFLPFALACVALLTLGLGLNARHDPEAPAPPSRAWGRALVVGGVSLAVVAGAVALV